MKRTVFVALTMLALASGILSAQADQGNEAYIKAMTASSNAQKVQALKEYLAQYAGKGSQYENFANANIALLAYQGKSARETIDYGEKALALGGLDDLTKYQLLVSIGGVFINTGQNLEKAKGYALQAVEVAKANKAREADNPGQWNQLMGAAHFVNGQACEKSKDYKGAAEAYATSYNILKNPQVLAELKKLGKTLYDSKNYAEAVNIFKVVSATAKNPEITSLYANALYKSGKTDEALVVFKEIYASKKNGDTAFNIGIILAKEAKTDTALTGEAIKYLLEASLLSPTNSKQAMSMAESLFFTTNKDLRWNETVTQIQGINKKIEDLTKTYNTKFGDKDEEELTGNQKKEMENILNDIEDEKKGLEKLKASQNAALAKFTAQIDEAKKRLGIR